MLLTLLICGAGVSLISLLVYLARLRDVRRAAWIGIVGVGWWMTIAVYAMATYAMDRNLHGRYLVGAYLAVLGVISADRTDVPDRFTTPGLRPFLTFIAAAAVHAYSRG